MKLLKFLLLLIFVSSPWSVSAQVSNQMEDMFRNLGSVSNYTAPGELNGTLEGGISGGSLVIRNRNMSPSLFNFSPPHFGAGCGGLDLFGGAFSMISKEQMTAYLRQIAAGAATYAFDLGLKALCPMCASDMQKLQEWTQAHNLSNMSSCQIAEAAIDRTGLKGYADQRYSEWLAAQNGGKSDDSANSNQGPGKNSTTMDLATSNPALAQQIIPGNTVFRAMKAGTVDAQFAGGNDQLIQDIMSLTGTIIVCQPNTGACKPATLDTSNRPGQLNTTTVEHTAELSDLVFGTTGGSTVTLLVCDDTSDCFNPQPKVQSDFKGFAQRLRNEFLGDADGDPSAVVGGLIGKIHDQTAALSTTDISYLNAFGQFGGMVRNLAVYSPSAARLFVQQFSDTVASQYVYNLARDMLEAAATAAAKSPTDYNGNGLKLVKEARTRLDADYAKLAGSPVIAAGMLAYYTQTMNSMAPVAFSPTMSRVH